MKTLALSKEGMSLGASDQICAHGNLAAVVGLRINVISVACIVDHGDNANLLALAFRVEVKAMASNPRQKNRVEV
jgi:hypothetical protein